jgi:hypothetical protein
MDEALYIRRDGNVVSYATYFNSFSIYKWLKYTKLDNVAIQVSVRGKAKLLLYEYCLADGKTQCKILSEHTAEGDTICAYDVKFDSFVFAFGFEPITPGAELVSGEYISDVSTVTDVNIIIAMATNHREKYVSKLIETLTDALFSDQDSPLYGHLQINITDNARTLCVSNTEFIHTFEQDDLGGSGGVVRSIIEGLYHNKMKFTHILILDDDIDLDFDTLILLFSFLRILKPEYYDRQICGAMFRNDQKSIQFDSGAVFKGIGVESKKRNLDMTRFENVLFNEIEEKVEYAAWFFCCMSVKVYKEKGFSFPAFMKLDDAEYGVRMGKNQITLNGIMVWHDNFESKYGIGNLYYAIRNELIAGTMHRRIRKADYMWVTAVRAIYLALTHRYEYAFVSCKAAEDFLNGIEWLAELDVKKNYEELMSKDYKQFEYHARNKHKISSRIFPMKNRVSFFRCMFSRRAVFLNEYTGKAFIVEFSFDKLLNCLMRLLKTEVCILRDFTRIANEYFTRKGEITSREFWDKYLGLTSNIEEDDLWLNRKY